MLNNQENKPDFEFKHNDVTLSFEGRDIEEIVSNFASFLEVCSWSSGTILLAMYDCVRENSTLIQDDIYGAKNHWIPLDIPPDVDESFPVVRNGKIEMAVYSTENGKELDTGEYYGWGVDGVTHWCYLPEEGPGND